MLIANHSLIAVTGIESEVRLRKVSGPTNFCGLNRINSANLVDVSKLARDYALLKGDQRQEEHTQIVLNASSVSFLVFVTSQTHLIFKGDLPMRDNTESTNKGSEQNRPFFARFLEGQDSAKFAPQTLKYPSDRDEVIWDEYMPGNNAPQQ